MTAPTAPEGEVRRVGGACTPIPSGPNQRLEASEKYRALRQMTRAERIAAMWRSELTLPASSANRPRPPSTKWRS